MPASLPPPEKIYEAWSAISSGRVKLLSPPESSSGHAEVLSSNGEKTYQLAWNNDHYSSTDSATWWQSWPGYPVLALLMLQHKLPYNPELGKIFKDVDWNRLNRKYKRDYSAAFNSLVNELAISAPVKREIKEAAEKTLQALENLNISTGRLYKSKNNAQS